jgi:hypothetical protein
MGIFFTGRRVPLFLYMKNMSKRFHDTEIWKQDWFLELPYEYKFLWFYIKDTCDHAGIWKPNTKFVEFVSGKPIDLKKAQSLFNGEKGRIEVLTNGRWLIPDFIVFQYGHNLNPKNRVHQSVLGILATNEVKLTSIRGLLDPKHRVKDKDKDKDSINKGVVKGDANYFDAIVTELYKTYMCITKPAKWDRDDIHNFILRIKEDKKKISRLQQEFMNAGNSGKSAKEIIAIVEGVKYGNGKTQGITNDVGSLKRPKGYFDQVTRGASGEESKADNA